MPSVVSSPSFDGKGTKKRAQNKETRFFFCRDVGIEICSLGSSKNIAGKHPCLLAFFMQIP